RVGRTGALLDPARALEAVEEARDPGRCQEDLLGEVDPAQRTLLRPREVEQHLVVVEREPVLGDELRVQLTGERGVAAEVAHPRRKCLIRQYLTTQCSPAKVVDRSSTFGVG